MALDARLCSIYKRLLANDLDGAQDEVEAAMKVEQDKNIKYQLFVAWAVLTLGSIKHAHDVIRNLHYANI